MTKTRNYRELSRKRKVMALTPKAWIILGGLCFFSMFFANKATEILIVLFLGLFFYIVLFIAERFDEDIFEILTIIFTQKLGGKKFYA